MSRGKKRFLNASQYRNWAVRPAARFQSSNKRFVPARFDRARRVTQRVIRHNKHSRGKSKITLKFSSYLDAEGRMVLLRWVPAPVAGSSDLGSEWCLRGWLARESCCAFSASRVCLRASWSPVCGFPAWRAAWRVAAKRRMRRYTCAQSRRAWKRSAPITRVTVKLGTFPGIAALLTD